MSDTYIDKELDEYRQALKASNKEIERAQNLFASEIKDGLGNTIKQNLNNSTKEISCGKDCKIKTFLKKIASIYG